MEANVCEKCGGAMVMDPATNVMKCEACGHVNGSDAAPEAMSDGMSSEPMA